MDYRIDKLSFDSVRGFTPEQKLRNKINELVDEINKLNELVKKLEANQKNTNK